MRNLETRVKKLEKQCGETGFRLVARADGETDDEARERAGMADWPGVIVFMSELDAKL